ncbi:exodeoxyribonuclease VII small subunit [Candidatus Azambacteria bacterium]|nr:exodeoxyribonuclease VII small subunit [Candidatus Azambacteria bacterium]
MKNLKDSLKKLKEIVEWFDKAEEVDIEAGLEKIKEGTALIKESRLTLKNLENEFEKVKNDLEDNNEEGINNGLKNKEK